MIKKLTFLLLLLVTVSYSANALVDKVKTKPRRAIKLADRLYAESVFYTASEYYKDALDQKPGNRYVTYWLAMSLMKAKDYARAELYFDRFLKIKPGTKDNPKKWEKQDKEYFSKANLYYGQMLHRNGKYDEAISALNKFINFFDGYNQEEKAYFSKLAKMEIAGCEYSKNPTKAKIKAKPLSHNINHEYTESSPYCVDDSVLFYSSLVSDTLIYFKGWKSGRVAQEMVAFKDGKDWTKGKALPASINNPKYITGNGKFNQDKTHFYFTRCLEVDDDKSMCNLFVSDVKNGRFNEPFQIPKPINDDKYTTTQPAVRTNANGTEVIYFVSDRPGGKGGMDIWFFTRTKAGDFKGPRPMKGAINTMADEITPFYDDSTKTLYFSSDGHPGLGGFDVFKVTESEDSGWSAVENLGLRMNTGADELGYFRAYDQTHGYFASNREGSTPIDGIKTGGDDLFGWENFKYAVEGAVSKEGEQAANKLNGAMFNLYRKNADGTKELIGVDSTSTGGNYFFKLNPDEDYVVEAIRPGFQNKTEEITTRNLDNEDTLNKNLKVKKDDYIGFGEVMDDDSINPKPVKGATAYLFEITPDGKERLIAEDGTGGSNIYHLPLKTDRNYKVVVKKEGYFTGSTLINTSNRGNIDSIQANVKLRKIEINKDYKLANILYAFGKFDLLPQSKLVLDTLYGILADNPKFVIELSAHTDSVGSEKGNMLLSQKRAESCVKYLITKGIPKTRMVPVGYGKSKPVAPNSTPDGKDDPDGRALNRRTEFKIIKELK